jgi:hypothetical protein
MAVWLSARSGSKTSERLESQESTVRHLSLTGPKVKRVHVEKRENPIVNRLNKTKIEKYPDLAMEKEARQKELRLKDRDAQQARVRPNLLVPRLQFTLLWSLGTLLSSLQFNTESRR